MVISCRPTLNYRRGVSNPILAQRAAAPAVPSASQYFVRERCAETNYMSIRLRFADSGKGDLRFCFGAKFLRHYFFAKPNHTRRNKNSVISAPVFCAFGKQLESHIYIFCEPPKTFHVLACLFFELSLQKKSNYPIEYSLKSKFLFRNIFCLLGRQGNEPIFYDG